MAPCCTRVNLLTSIQQLSRGSGWGITNSEYSPADAGLDVDLWYIENILTDYDSQHLQTSESS